MINGKKSAIIIEISIVMLLIISTFGLVKDSSVETQINDIKIKIINSSPDHTSSNIQALGIHLVSTINPREINLPFSGLQMQSWQLYTVNQTSAARGTGVNLDNQKRPHIFYYQPAIFTESLIHSYWDGEVWQHETVAPASIYHNSGPMAFIDSSGIIHVFYFNDQEKLGYAWFDDEWNIETIDTNGDTGDFNSIVFDSSNTPHIIYSVGFSSARYATKTNDQWQIYNLPGSSSGSVSIALDSQENPHMFYKGNYYHYDGSTWCYESVSGISSDSYMTLDFDNQPHISYYWIEGSSYDLRYAYKNNGVWQYRIIDPGYQQSKRGWYNHIDIDQYGVLHISYLDHNLCHLKHAWGFGDSWDVEIVEQLGSSAIWDTGNDIKIDGNNIYFSYYNEITEVIRLATLAVDFAPPENLTAEVINENNVFLSWNHPGMLSLVMPSNYRIYQNNEMIAEIESDNSDFLVEDLEQGAYDFHVTAMFNNENESLPSNHVTIVIGEAKEDLSCSGTLSWSKVKPGSTVSAEILVENIGDATSLLDWEIESYPDWGSWTFNPISGTNLTPEDGAATVIVEVIAPLRKNSKLTGQVKIVNLKNTSDFCLLEVTLITPVSYQHSILLSVLQRLPNTCILLWRILDF